MNDILTEQEKTTLKRHLENGTYKTSDPWHTYIKDGILIYQWGFIEERPSDPSHLTILYETSNQVEFQAKQAAFEEYIRSLGYTP